MREPSGATRVWRGRSGGGGPGWVRGALRLTGGVALSLAAAGVCFRMHWNLSAAGSVQLLLIVLVALRWSFWEAAAVSAISLGCLNYLFTTPLFAFSVALPENWIALGTFEATALLVSALSSKVREHAAEAERQRRRTAKLYELSKAILLIDGQQGTLAQLASLVRELIEVETVELWDADAGSTGGGTGGEGVAESAYRNGTEGDERDVSTRLLRLGTTPIGAMVLRGWVVDAMMADAVASLAAVAVERARALGKENRAEAARQTEQLRTTVLDSLAHAFKTPLTAVLTASSGLLAIGRLDATQEELVTLIDDEAKTLNGLTTRLLQTAALEAREIRPRPSTFDMAALVEEVVGEEDAGRRRRIECSAAGEETPVRGDAQLVRFALEQLLDNALKYSPVDSTVHVAVRQMGAEMMVSVVNAGTAIPAAERERIFERFYRGAGALQGPAGTGLGLSIVKKAAEAHRGRAWVECAPDRTSFFFTVENHLGMRHERR